MNMHLSNEYKPHDSEVMYNRGTSQNMTNSQGLHNVSPTNMPYGGSSNIGQVLTGEIIQVTPNTVQLLLQDQSVITARLEGNVNLSLHSTMSFEVSNSQGHNLLLRPLYMNTANNQTLLKALEAAGIPKNEKTIELVSKQMETNQPIDKSTLQRVYQQILEYPNAKVSDILALRELGLPVNENNLTQYSTCMNLKETFSNTLTQLESQIMSVVNEIITSNNPERVTSFLQEIVKAFSESSVGGTDIMKQPADAVSVVTGQTVETFAGATSGRVASPVTQASSIVTDSTLVTQMAESLQAEPQNMQDRTVSSENTEISMDTLPQKPQGTLTDASVNVQSDPLQSLKVILSNPQQINLKELEQTIKRLFEKNLVWDPAKMSDDSKEVLKTFVKQLYNKVMSTTENLAKIDITQFPEAANLQKSASQTQNQVQFLNDLNQSIMYLQIPLKASESLKDGHLHVYARNRKLNAPQDEITALIHLDMEHLGPVSVHVTLRDNHIGTKFYLKDEETIDLVEQHIDMLDKRIKGRGYDFHAEMTQIKQDYEPQKVLKNEMGFTEEAMKDSCIGQYSFDVRA